MIRVSVPPGMDPAPIVAVVVAWVRPTAWRVRLERHREQRHRDRHGQCSKFCVFGDSNQTAFTPLGVA